MKKLPTKDVQKHLKKPYKTPKFETVGTLAEVTKLGPGSNGDGAGYT